MAFFIDFKILKYSIVNTIEIVDVKKDSSEPYEMIDFIKNLDIDNIGNQFVVDSYNKYLIEWTNIKNQTTESFDSIRRRKYIQLLQNIQLNYLNQDEQRILGNIDWTDDLEIEIAIPFFVEKIKETIEYYINKRRDVKNSKAYRPTLFDLLSHNALTFYKTDENSITKPAYKFSIDDALYLKDSEQFINATLSAKGSLSLQLNALKIYKNLLKFHRKKTASKAFVTVDIERLKFVLQHTTLDTKETIYLDSLSKS